MENKFTEYAADMTVVLAYFKALDDWKDEKKPGKRWYAGILSKAYQEVEKAYPRQCQAVSSSIQELEVIEKDRDSNPDQAINCSGKMLSELFVCEEDFWSNSLRTFGYELGRFIYLMDATLDYKKDFRKRNYNPLFKMGKRPEEMEGVFESASRKCYGGIRKTSAGAGCASAAEYSVWRSMAAVLRKAAWEGDGS